MIKKRCLLVIALLLSLCLGNVSIYADDGGDSLEKYKKEINIMNEKLGTNYEIITEEEADDAGINYQDAIESIQSMSLDEFDKYIETLYSDNIDDNVSMQSDGNSIATQSDVTLKQVEQRHYYDNYGNFFSVVAKIATNTTTYVQYIKAGYNTHAKGYPYYKASSASYKMLNGSKQMQVTYNCTKYLSATIIDGSYYKIGITYTAY